MFVDPKGVKAMDHVARLQAAGEPGGMCPKTRGLGVLEAVVESGTLGRKHRGSADRPGC